MNDAVREKVDRLDRALLDTNEPPVRSSRLQELKIKAHEMELQKCDQMLTDAGVPEWVMNSDSNGVPSNSVESRLKWYLARRKNVKRWETDQTLQREMEESLRHAQAYTQAERRALRWRAAERRIQMKREPAIRSSNLLDDYANPNINR